MKRLILAIIISLSFIFGVNAAFGKTVYLRTERTGGGSDSLDAVNGASLSDGDAGFVFVGNQLYSYMVDEDSGAAENDPLVIAPDTNPSTKRWILQKVSTSGGGTNWDSSGSTGLAKITAGSWSTVTDNSTDWDATTTTVDAGSANWDTAYDDRLKWDGGDTDLVPATGRTSLELDSIASATTSGAYYIGVFDEFENSTAENIQDVLDDLDASIAAGGITERDLVPGEGLTFEAGESGGNDILPGTDSDVTLKIDTTEMTGPRTWGDGTDASIIWTFDILTGDPSVSFGPGGTVSTDGDFYAEGTLIGSLTSPLGGYATTITAEDFASSIVLDEQTFEVEGEGTQPRLFKLQNVEDADRTLKFYEDFTIGDGYTGILTYSGDSKTLTVEDNSTVNQDLTTDASPTFSSVSADLTGNADSATVATTLTVTDNESTNEENAILFTANAEQEGGNLAIESDGTLRYNPGTGIVYSVGFEGDLTGNVTGRATYITVTANDSTDETVYPIFTDGQTISEDAENDIGFTYNPSSGLLTVESLSTGEGSNELYGMEKDLVTTAPITGGSNNVLYGPDGDLTIGITVEKDLVVTGPLTGSTNDVFPGSDADITIGIDVDKDIVAGVGLSGGADDVLTGPDSDVTLTLDTTEVTGERTWNDGSTDAIFTWIFDVNSGTDPGITFTDGVINVSAGTLQVDGNEVVTTASDQETIEDYVGGMVSGNTETGITVTYEDGDGTLDFVVTEAPEFTVTANNSADETVYPIFVDGATGSQGAETDTGLTYNPSSGIFTSTAFVGDLTGDVTGNADTATALETARDIGGTSFDGTASITPINITVADTTDTTSYVALWESATGNLEPKSDAGITYNAGTGALTATSFSGSGASLTSLDGENISDDTIDDDSIDFSDVTFADFDYETAWRMWYSNAAGDVTELALEANGTFLESNGATSAPAFRALEAADIPDISGTYQPLDADLTALAALSSTGLVARTGADTYSERTIQGDANEITVTNGDGVSGNPSLSIDLNKDIVTTAPITGGTNDVLVGADSDITIAITVEKDIVAAGTGMSGGSNDVLPGSDGDVTITLTTDKDIVTTAPLTGGENDVLPGADADLTLALTVEKDIVAGKGLSGGSNNVLPGSDADVTLTVDTTEMTGNVTWDDNSTDASITWTYALSGATDPVWTISNNSMDLTTGVLKVGGVEIAGNTAEEIEDYVGAMVSGNTESGITVTYQDGDGTLDFTVTEAPEFTVTANNSTDETVYPIFVDGATGSQGAETDTGFTYNPSSGNLVTTTLNGITLTGSAGTLQYNDVMSLILSGGNNVTISSAGQANVLALNESLTVGNGYTGTLTYSGLSKVLTVEDTTNVNQDLTSDASPTFAGLTLSASVDGTTQLIVRNTDSSLASETHLIEGQHTADGDTNADFIKLSDAYGGSPETLFEVEYDGRTNIGAVASMSGPSGFSTTGAEGEKFQIYSESDAADNTFPAANVQTIFSFPPADPDAAMITYIGSGLFYTRKDSAAVNTPIRNLQAIVDARADGNGSSVALGLRAIRRAYGSTQSVLSTGIRQDTAADGQALIGAEFNIANRAKDPGNKEDGSAPVTAYYWGGAFPVTTRVGPEDFAADSGWTKGTGWTIAGGVASHAAGTGSNLSETSPFTNEEDKAYEVTFTISNYVAGTLTPYIDSDAGLAVSADGTYTQVIVASSTASAGIIFTADAAFDGDLDDVTVKEALFPVTHGLYLNSDGDEYNGIYNGVFFTDNVFQPNGIGINYNNPYDGDAGPLHGIKVLGYYGDSYASGDVDVVTFDGAATWANITSEAISDDGSYANNFLTDNDDVLYIGSVYLFDAIRIAKSGASDYAVGAGPVKIYYYDGIDFTQEVDGLATEREAGAVGATNTIDSVEVIERVIRDETMSGTVSSAVADGGNTGTANLTSSGTLTGEYSHNYKIEIDGDGTPDTFKWSQDGGATWYYEEVEITGSAQTLDDGVSITFDSTTNADLGDIWTFTGGDCFTADGTMKFTIPRQWATGANSYNANLDADKYYVAVMITTSSSTDPDADLIVPVDGGYGAHIYAADSNIGLTVRSEADMKFRVGPNRTDNVSIGDNTLSLAAANTGYLYLGEIGDKNLAFDWNDIQARDNGSASALYLNARGGVVFIGDQSAAIDLWGDRIDIGDGSATADLIVKFDTGDQDGTLTWDEDPGEFDFDSSVTIAGTLDTGQGAYELYGMAKDLVAGKGLSGGGDDELYGPDGDLTVAVDLTEMTGNLVWGDGTDASVTHTYSLSGATDPVWTISNNSMDLTTGVLKVGGVEITGNTAEEIEDAIGAMVTGNTETGIAVTYQDGDGTLDFVLDYAMNQDLETTDSPTFANLTLTGDIAVNGDTITSDGTLTVDVATDIVLDADGGNLYLKDGGTEYADWGATNLNTNARIVELNENQTASSCYIDFNTDGQSSQGFRIIRYTGANGTVDLDLEGTGNMRFRTNGSNALTIDSSQNATFSADLDVTGDITADNFPADFVFEPGYKLPSLEELRTSILTTHKLPGLEVPNGISMKDLMVKTEEQALYILQLHDRLLALENRIDVLESRVNR